MNINIMKPLAAGALSALALTLAACDGDDPKRSTIHSIDDAKAKLDASDLACERWSPYPESEMAFCDLGGEQQTFSIVEMESSSMELYAAVKFDGDQDILEMVVGENWGFTCRLIPLTTCSEAAGVLGGEVLKRGDQGPEVVS
ncbi:hypothetical protein [uncultured Corynebacterium sp.]|uniref:hypothetical protein n=1 Tax=uncultured Corynebacterium sp. TaxID=159447 RepID=UPI0025DFD88E|nr:hypothetical protein [uncultured Corynebacterium sp.]